MANPAEVAAPVEGTSPEASAVPATAPAGELTATVVDHGGEAAHAEPEAFGFAGPGFIVSSAMLVFIGILLWKKVPAMLMGGLDAKIAEIRKQLQEAKTLRAEAEALRQEYATKIANAEKDAAAMLDHARHEADQIIAKAETDSAAMIARREKMAEDKIVAAQNSAIDELRARAAFAATAAAGDLIAAQHDAGADTKLVNEAISGI